ncbi:MAG: CAP domain-containing protein [Myxococcales bacterium]|nr:CAP domain-containing protein [Myxococcales bacterium]
MFETNASSARAARPLRFSMLCLAALYGCAASGEGGGGDASTSTSGALVTASVSGGDVVLTVDPDYVGGTLTITQTVAGAATPATVEVAISAAALRIPTDVPLATFAPLMAGAARVTLRDGEGAEVEGDVTIGERFTRFFEATADVSVAVTGAPTLLVDGATVTITGDAGSKGLQQRVWIARPSGPVTSLELGAEMVAPGAGFSFDVDATESGVYVVELTGANGLPAAVVPIYVGDALPLALSALDGGFTASKTVDAEVMATQVLALVNERRQGAGMTALASSPKLTGTAQFKADEMATAKYFAHASAVTGKTVADLAAEAGVTGQVAENIGVEYTPLRVFLGWWWSPAHRAPLMDALTKSHGLGAAVFDAASGQVVFAQHVGTE